MSRRRGSKNGKTFLIIFFLFLFFGGGIGSIVGPLLSIAAVFGGFAIFIFALVFLIVKLTKNRGYTDVKPNVDSKATVNPYSSTVNVTTPNVKQGVTPVVRPVTTGQTPPYMQTQNSATQVGARTVQPQQTVKQPEQPKAPVAPAKKSTGDADIDKMVEQKNIAIKEMRRLDDNIEDERVSAQIVHLEDVTEKITKYVVQHPKKKKQVAKFYSYYLPTTMKLLQSYDRMDQTGISGTNIDGTMDKVTEMMDTALAAFDKQLDALFADEALDVSTDISVMENMLKSEGLADDDLLEQATKAVKGAKNSDDAIAEMFAGLGTPEDIQDLLSTK